MLRAAKRLDKAHDSARMGLYELSPASPLVSSLSTREVGSYASMIRILLSLALLLSYPLEWVSGFFGMIAAGLLGPTDRDPTALPAAIAATVLSVYGPSLLLSWWALRRMRVKERLRTPVPGRHWLTAGLVCAITSFLAAFDLTGNGAPSWLSALLNSASFATIPLLVIGLALAGRSLLDRIALDGNSDITPSSEGPVPGMVRLTHLVLLTTSVLTAIAGGPTLLGIFGAMDDDSAYAWSWFLGIWLAMPLLALGLMAAILSIAVVVRGPSSHRWRLLWWWLCAGCAVFGIAQQPAAQSTYVESAAAGLVDAALVVGLLLCILLPCLVLRRAAERHWSSAEQTQMARDRAREP